MAKNENIAQTKTATEFSSTCSKRPKRCDYITPVVFFFQHDARRKKNAAHTTEKKTK